jgi:hypothetical protein
MIYGLMGGLAVLLIALLMPKKRCPRCGEYLPKFRAPRSWRQALWGGSTCPHCGCEVDRRGRVVPRRAR